MVDLWQGCLQVDGNQRPPFFPYPTRPVAGPPALSRLRQFLFSSTYDQFSQLMAVGVPGSEMAAFSVNFGEPEENAPDLEDWCDPHN